MWSLCNPRYCLCVLQTQTAAGCDIDATRGLRDESSQDCGTGEDVGGAAGGKDAMATGGDNIFQSLSEIGCLIEGAVEGRLQWSCHLDQGASTFDVDCAIGVEDADDDSCGSEAADVLEVFADCVEVCCRVVEALVVRAQNDMHW